MPVAIDDTAAYLDRSISALQALAGDTGALALLDTMAARIAGSMRAGGKLLIAGNGGSAADAQHIAGEFVVRLVADRAPLPALALSTDTSVLTAAGNDYGFEQVFARQVLALGRPGDVLLAISTSGNSPNILRAVAAADARGLQTLGLTGAHGGALAAACAFTLRAPSASTAIVQQLHIALAHILCAKVEKLLGA